MNYLQPYYKPIIGTIVYGRYIGKSYYNKYIWWFCEQCLDERYVRIEKGVPRDLLCLSCSRSGENSVLKNQ